MSIITFCQYYYFFSEIFLIVLKTLLFFSAKIDNSHKEFQKAIRASICNYVPERGVLSVISRDVNSKKLAAMIQEMHFRNLGQKVVLLKRTEEAARQLETTKLHTIGG